MAAFLMLLVVALTLSSNDSAGAEADPISTLTNHLGSLVYRLRVGDPDFGLLGDGPKALVTAFIDADPFADLAVGNTDGSISVFFGKGDGTFNSATNLRTVAHESLRGLVADDLNGDGRPELVVAAPFQGRIYIFTNQCVGDVRAFAPASFVEAWRGVRNLTTGDFDGDGRRDLVAAGPNTEAEPKIIGLKQYRSRVNALQVEVTNDFSWLGYKQVDPEKFPKPVYSLKSFRPVGASRDWLAVTHAETNLVWVLEPNTNGMLQLRGTVTNDFAAHGLAIAPILSAAGSGSNDLIIVGRDAGRFVLRPADSTSPSLFSTKPFSFDVPGGPRAVSVVDLNSDGWNDLVVVQRNLDSVVTYANTNGTLTAISEQTVGASPRDLAAADFNGDGYPDLAVLNRDSQDISVLLANGQQTGFRTLDHLYPVDGNVVGLVVVDFNHDGKDDVVQLHRASGDFSVRLATDGGALLPPVYYTVGNIPATLLVSTNSVITSNLATTNLVFTSNLGTERLERGSVSYRYVAADGSLSGESRIDLPEDSPSGRLFALVPGDFNGDGNIDLAAGFLGSRLIFFIGTGSGEFVNGVSQNFVPQARSLVAADLDKDGDLDLAGVGVSGEVWILINPGTAADRTANLMNTLVTPIVLHPPTDFETLGARKILATEYDHEDNVLDLIVGSGKGAWVYRGVINGDGTYSVMPPTVLTTLANFVSDMLFEDLDKDGNKDLVISCRGQDCLTIMKGTSKGVVSGLPMDAPSTKFIATGDLDGDGRLDLVGTGRVLWTSLSSNAPRPAVNLDLSPRARLNKPVINEILAVNTEVDVVDALGKNRGHVDFVEVYVGGQVEGGQNPLNWHLVFVPEGEGLTKTFTFPFAASMATSNHLLFIFSEKINDFYHTGFRLSGDGGWLILSNSLLRTNFDVVHYPPQRPNISYARYRDGVNSFVFNPFPSPGKANPINGTVDPTLSYAGVDPASVRSTNGLRLYADVADDVGVSSLVMYYQRLDRDGGNLPRQRVVLEDTGETGADGAASRRFVAQLNGPLANTAEIEFYFELTDLNDQVVVLPDEASFTTVDAPGNTFQFAFNTAASRLLEISELVADSTSQSFGTNSPDWVEVRNISVAPVAMKDFSLSHQIGENSRYNFPTGLVLQAGQHYVVLCDSDITAGETHAPFRLDRSGDLLMLTGLTTNRSRTLVDWVSFGPQERDSAWARLGAGGPFHAATPTPYLGNVESMVVDNVDRGWLGQWFVVGGQLQYFFGFPTQPAVPYVVKRRAALDTGGWTPIEQFIGNGIEHVFRAGPTNAGFFRWERSQ